MSPTITSRAEASQRAYAMTLRALDPARSVVVEACAGSGKTWLLASRIVRLLLAGVAPGEILAITFTRKAAREIEERVVDWLHLLATGRDEQVDVFLSERGVSVDAFSRRAARALYEQVLTASPGLAVNTFHGWFLQLVAAAPLSANLAGATLVDSDSRLFDELWQSFAAELPKAPESELTQAFVHLLAEVGLDSTRRLIRRALDRRSEWLAYAGDDRAGAAANVVTGLRAQLKAGEPGQALSEFFMSGWALDFQAYLGFLEMSELKGDQDAATTLRVALSADEAAVQFEHLRTVLLTRENTLRAKKPGKTLDKRFSPDGAFRFLALHAQLGERVLDCLEAQRAERILAFNQDACIVFQCFLKHVEEFKRARRQIDFVDAEWNVLKLLRDEQTAAFLQARLDARYRHVLLDEFQDTNPLQWQILLAWLDAYSDASRPVIFLVGDPKQSIYRFRRAEPRLFAVAAGFLEHSFDAVLCEQDATRRNAQALIDVINALFLDVPDFEPFREQTSFAGALPGRVELMPLCGNVQEEGSDKEQGSDEASITRHGLRDPLLEPALVAEDSRLRQEAQCLAAKIGEMVGLAGAGYEIEGKGADGVASMRPARFGDFMLLVRTRTHLAVYERALSAANIPFDAGSRGGLLAALEVRDIVALLEFLVTPAADLKLAQTLRSPLFACSDDDLMLLAACDNCDGGAWWQRLQIVVGQGGATPHLVRAKRWLSEWLQAADKLPAHDLLDRIFHQGEVIARYRLAAPAAASASVEANLRELLLLALDLDGGRYPSLPRFIDELRDLRDADGNDAPDEGAIGMHDAAAGRVRILTIHGAKGLEAPIVWLLGANAMPRAQDAWDVLVDWPPEAPAPQHFSFFGRKEERGAARQALFENEAAAARREELNLLYVAITRARQVFIASGVESARRASETPYQLLADALLKLGAAFAYGEELPRAANPELPLSVRGAQAPAGDLPLPPIGERRQTPDAAERFGILLHALLERRAGDGASVGSWWRALGFEDSDYARVLPVAERLLQAPALRRFFEPTSYRRAWNEVELTTGDGSVQRIDRLIEFETEIWVVDYKSSGQQTLRLAEYRQQVGEYCRVVAEVFPEQRVHGGLIFADATLIEVC